MSNNDVVIIQLDRPRELRFGYKALKSLEALTGVALSEIDKNLDSNQFEIIEKMAFVALRQDARNHGETLTLEQMEDLLDCAPSFAHAVEKVMAAWYIAFGAETEQSAGNPPEPVTTTTPASKSTGKKANA